MEIKRFIIFYTPRSTVPEYQESISISPLDELLLTGNYLHTIDGSLVDHGASELPGQAIAERGRGRDRELGNRPERERERERVKINRENKMETLG